MEPSIFLAATTDAGTGPPPWITTALYLWLAMLCAWAWWGGRGNAGRIGSLSWLALMVLFAALAVAKPFGAQWMLADVFRRRAVEGDWYEVRRRFQGLIILGVVAASALAAVAVAAIAIRRRSYRTLASFAPVAALIGFLAVRATSLHQIDAVLYRRVGGAEVNTLVEWAILGLVAVGLVWRASAGSGRAADAATAQDDGVGARRYSIR